MHLPKKRQFADRVYYDEEYYLLLIDAESEPPTDSEIDLLSDSKKPGEAWWPTGEQLEIFPATRFPD